MPNRPADDTAIRPQNVDPHRTHVPSRGRGGGSREGFREILEGELKVTIHARERMNKDGVDMSRDQEDRMQVALDRVAKRGGRQSLVLLDDLAMIVNVESRTLITVVPGERRGEGVFTDIDSAVIAD